MKLASNKSWMSFDALSKKEVEIELIGREKHPWFKFVASLDESTFKFNLFSSCFMNQERDSEKILIYDS